MVFPGHRLTGLKRCNCVLFFFFFMLLFLSFHTCRNCSCPYILKQQVLFPCQVFSMRTYDSSSKQMCRSQPRNRSPRSVLATVRSPPPSRRSSASAAHPPGSSPRLPEVGYGAGWHSNSCTVCISGRQVPIFFYFLTYSLFFQKNSCFFQKS